MYFNREIKKKNKLYKKKLVKFESKFNINTLNFFISKHPKLKGGRKNYIKKEVNKLLENCDWLDIKKVQLDELCLGPCDKYLFTLEGEAIGWKIPPKSKLYTKPIKYKNESAIQEFNDYIHIQKLREDVTCL